MMDALHTNRTFWAQLIGVIACMMASPLWSHEGVPIDPGITEDSPREFSQLYLERKSQPWTDIEEGIAYQEIRTGQGPPPHAGSIVYIMWRMFDQKDGKEIFYRTKHRTDHFFFDTSDAAAFGGASALHAVEAALREMKEGGKRIVRVSSAKAFGKEGWSDSHFLVSPDTDIVIELSLLWVRDPNPKRMSATEPHARPGEIPAARKDATTSAPIGG